MEKSRCNNTSMVVREIELHLSHQKNSARGAENCCFWTVGNEEGIVEEPCIYSKPR